jgi:hypothetical protein
MRIASSEELNGFIDDTFTSSCGLHELKDGMINLMLDSLWKDLAE